MDGGGGNMDQQRSRSVTIALADDDPAVRSTFAHLLQALGHTVAFTAANGEELVEQCSQTRVDLVFADLHMPVMDGLEAAEQIAATGIPVILISGHPDAEAVVVENEPLVSVIRKPPTVESLETAIAAAAGSRGA